MKRRMRRDGRESGFTLIEILIYSVIFSVSAIFLVNILTSITQTQVRQTSVNDVNQQISFVSNTIQRLIRESSLIQNDTGVASSTLVLRMSSSTTDETRIYTDASSTAVYLKQIDANGASTTLALTDDKVTVGNFSVTKYEVPGGQAVVQVDLTLNYNTSVSRAKVARTWRGAVSRISAATFDSSLTPSGTTLDLGSQTAFWRDAYVSGNLQLGPSGGYSTLSGTDVRVKSTVNLAVAAAGGGLIVKTPDGLNCYLISVTNAGAVTSTLSNPCP